MSPSTRIGTYVFVYLDFSRKTMLFTHVIQESILSRVPLIANSAAESPVARVTLFSSMNPKSNKISLKLKNNYEEM